ncbi:hypothetical protein NE857_28455 [Nocardiopsis exhalans]|uniref:Secreted protein n=1 Tax=Nocardiopsis exhalans TaxID=163604 RepID=A0ABY5D467_9ACTN|nr:hypothetical protein [Nocardiopsis exhalans]USY19159.1 hypothetical protein NE857_28455 [Nocardiopsis exhalans]
MRCVLTTTTHRRRTVALCGAVLLATACGQSHGHTPQQLSEMIAETVRDSAGAGSLGLGIPDTAFDPARFACAPAVDPELPGGWRSQAPRAAVEDGEPVELGLSDTQGHSGTVTAAVTGPDGETALAEAALGEGEWIHLDYPDAFDGAELVPGVYTVVWSDTESGAPITCDGFEVE